MVAEDEMLVTLQRTQEFKQLGRPLEGQIADDVYSIPSCNYIVPVADQDGVISSDDEKGR